MGALAKVRAFPALKNHELKEFGNRLLWEIEKIDAEVYNHGPYAAFVFELKNAREMALGEDISLSLTYNEQTEPDFAAQTGILRVLQEDPIKHFDPKLRRFKVKQIMPQNLPPQLMVLFGIDPKYYEEPYSGSVEAMYHIDELGFNILKEGLKNDREPWFVYSNYNFNNIEGLPSQNLRTLMSNPSLERILDSIKSSKESESGKWTLVDASPVVLK